MKVDIKEDVKSAARQTEFNHCPPFRTRKLVLQEGARRIRIKYDVVVIAYSNRFVFKRSRKVKG